MQKVFEEIIEKLKKVGNLQSINHPSNPYISLKGAITIVEQSAKEHDWIPFTHRNMDREEFEEFQNVIDYDYEDNPYILDCKLPEEDEEILVTYASGYVDTDTFLRDGFDCYLDSGCEFVTEAIAWMPKPDGFKPNKDNK